MLIVPEACVDGVARCDPIEIPHAALNLRTGVRIHMLSRAIHVFFFSRPIVPRYLRRVGFRFHCMPAVMEGILLESLCAKCLLRRICDSYSGRVSSLLLRVFGTDHVVLSNAARSRVQYSILAELSRPCIAVALVRSSMLGILLDTMHGTVSMGS